MDRTLSVECMSIYSASSILILASLLCSLRLTLTSFYLSVFLFFFLCGGGGGPPKRRVLESVAGTSGPFAGQRGQGRKVRSTQTKCKEVMHPYLELTSLGSDA